MHLDLSALNKTLYLVAYKSQVCNIELIAFAQGANNTIVCVSERTDKKRADVAAYSGRIKIIQKNVEIHAQ